MSKFKIAKAKDNKPDLKQVPLDQPKQPRKPGSGKGQILYIAPDFDATPKAFEAYSFARPASWRPI